ncbi:hypothetical protein MNBD_GAMMA04-1285 [hydrothermal vent metagenome]|uniref:Ice-binding protein C-terminal domain-containing protein n=1 Tax=hydrothermal vent metagenome TaxID=652676 RepID=A0A3B0VU76_9ZZZZ
MTKTVLLLAALSLGATQANAAVFSFDDIPGGSIQNNYGDMPTYNGFNYSSKLVWIDVEDSPNWNYGAKSGDFAILNNYQGIGTITEENGEDFTFDGLWAKKWGSSKDSGGTNFLFGTLQGYNNGLLVWSVDTSLNGSYTYYGAQLGSIDELKLGLGNNFLVDDLALTTVSPVPEPSSIALMLGGLGLVGFMAARRAKKTG